MPGFSCQVEAMILVPSMLPLKQLIFKKQDQILQPNFAISTIIEVMKTFHRPEENKKTNKKLCNLIITLYAANFTDWKGGCKRFKVFRGLVWWFQEILGTIFWLQNSPNIICERTQKVSVSCYLLFCKQAEADNIKQDLLFHQIYYSIAKNHKRHV